VASGYKGPVNEAVVPPPHAAVAPTLLAWYDRHRRVLPWRSPPGVGSDPYAVWLSEIMLQQTTVAAVKPYYAAFLRTWPRVEDLAAAALDDVLKAWAGLGYYSRARNLHACARAVVSQHDGHFPGQESALRKLPGIGPYTAAAIAAIAFGRRAVVVDGNVERVMARLFAVGVPLPAAKPLLHAAMDRVTPADRTGDFAQAVMDLGATICTPRNPACVVCPLMAHCQACRDGTMNVLPRKLPKGEVPRRGGAVFIVSRPDGALLVRRRAAEGLFGGMTEFPSTAWTTGFDPTLPVTPPSDMAGLGGVFRRIGRVDHGLTHFSLSLDVYHAATVDAEIALHRWVLPQDLIGEALPTLMRKVLAAYTDARAVATEGASDGLSPRRPPSPARPGSRRHRRPQTGRLRAGP
jgi:A/G-specific adenine glycosylase